MIKPTVQRGLMLDFAADIATAPINVHESRILNLNNKSVKNGEIIYFSTREHRLEDNWGFIFSYNLAKNNNQKFKVVILKDEKNYSKAQSAFMMQGIDILMENLKINNIECDIVTNSLPKYFADAGAIVIDFNPIFTIFEKLKKYNCSIFEVDSHNIIPARYISDKQEFSAAHFRLKVYKNISNFLTEFPVIFKYKKNNSYPVLKDFIENKLKYYNEFKNDPNKNVTSKLSPYLHFGQISSQRIAMEIINSTADRINKEAYLEELIVRKELSDNYCLYNKNFKSIEGIPPWSKETLNNHKRDVRAYLYDLKTFEEAKTHDRLWNAAQKSLLKNNFIHGFLRMYWAKKILEWSGAPQEATEIAVYLNDKYSLDGIDPNGYCGILWSIGGLHDRPFIDRMISGKIRYMSMDGCKKKFDIDKYVSNHI